jgi:hypothetical protein
MARHKWVEYAYGAKCKRCGMKVKHRWRNSKLQRRGGWNKVVETYFVTTNGKEIMLPGNKTPPCSGD